METKKKYIGLMDPNHYAFLRSLENLIAHIDPKIKIKNQNYDVVTERVKCKPYDVLNSGETHFDVIMNRGSHWNPHRNSLFTILSTKVHLIYNMFSFKTIDKNSGYGQMGGLGINIPPTWAIPQQDYSELDDPKIKVPIHKDLIFEDHELFNLQSIGETVGYPAFLKPQDGGGWVGVEKVINGEELQKAYDKSGEKPQNLQHGINYKEFVRSVGIGPQIMPMHYNADSKYSHDRYIRSEEKAIEHNFITEAEKKEIVQIIKIINAFYGWDHNSCEALISKDDDKIYVIDFANAYPDSDVISLHYYFPGVVKAMAKWLIYCAFNPRHEKFNFMGEWHKYFKVLEEANKKGLSYQEKLDKYEKLADDYFETKKFNEFCEEHLADFDTKALEFFSGEKFEAVLEEAVKRYFRVPDEVPEKMAHYKGLHRFWIHCEKTRLGIK
jgi:hypothetical protein